MILMLAYSQNFNPLLIVWWRKIIHKVSKGCTFKKKESYINIKNLRIKNERQKIYYLLLFQNKKELYSKVMNKKIVGYHLDIVNYFSEYEENHCCLPPKNYVEYVLSKRSCVAV